MGGRPGVLARGAVEVPSGQRERSRPIRLLRCVLRLEKLRPRAAVGGGMLTQTSQAHGVSAGGGGAAGARTGGELGVSARSVAVREGQQRECGRRFAESGVVEARVVVHGELAVGHVVEHVESLTGALAQGT